MNTPLIVGSNGFVAAIDCESGRELWRTKLGGFLSVTSSEDVSVLVSGPSVFAGCAGHVFCLSAETGSVLWHNQLPGMRNNDVSLALDGVSIQYLEKVEHHGS
jgi:hypothetical protein